MEVKLLAHTQISWYYDEFISPEWLLKEATDGQLVALTAIRSCYSSNKPTEIVRKEGDKYFGQKATDGESGTEADRLFRHIFRSKHLSTLEHITFTFAIEDISRACLAQLTRHRVGFSYSVSSQRYIGLGSNDKTNGFNYIIPKSIKNNNMAKDKYEKMMKEIQKTYDELRNLGIPKEDCRMVTPQATTCNLVMTANLRALLDFYSKRKNGRGAQWEIAELAEKLREEVVKVEPWVDKFFGEV